MHREFLGNLKERGGIDELDAENKTILNCT